jgi:hypothetical protein
MIAIVLPHCWELVAVVAVMLVWCQVAAILPCVTPVYGKSAWLHAHLKRFMIMNTAADPLQCLLTTHNTHLCNLRA